MKRSAEVLNRFMIALGNIILLLLRDGEYIEFMLFGASVYGDLLRMTTFAIYTSSDIFRKHRKMYHKK